MGTMRVLDGGMFTTVQDKGRYGFREFGVPVSGAMDRHSAEWANKLVGNPQEAPVLEMTMKGGRYRFESDGYIAISGAEMEPKINNRPIPIHQGIVVRAGDVLKFGVARRGCRAYLAIRGEWILNKIMGSYSTLTQAKLGGIEGRSLRANDLIQWKDWDVMPTLPRMPDAERPYFSSKLTVPIMPAREWEWLKNEEKEKLLNSVFTVSAQSNRMGIRLEGTHIAMPKRQMVSSPVTPGIIQLPEHGLPIILMNDGQTIGGYPRIAKVHDRDLWRLGQLKPGDLLRFSYKAQ